MTAAGDLTLEPHADGVLLSVQAQPKARRNGLNGIHDGRLKIQVTQAPEKGKANQAIIKLLASLLGVSKSSISVHTGETSSQKKLLITGVSPDELRDRLESLL